MPNRKPADIELMVSELVDAFYDDQKGLPQAIKLNPSGGGSVGVQIAWMYEPTPEVYTYHLRDLSLFARENSPPES